MRSRISRQRSSGPGRFVLLGAFDGAVEGDPSHRLRISEMLAPAAHLPDALVTVGPDLFQMHEKFALQVPAGIVGAEAAPTRLMQRVHNLAENVELQLVMRGIADTHRLRAFVARQPWHLPFGQPPLAADAIHDLDLLRTAGGRAQQPVAPHARLVVVAGIHQRQQRQRRIAQPAETVIPVALAPDAFRQRGGGRGHHAPGRCKGERLERDQRALHRFVPRAIDLTFTDPIGPEPLGLTQGFLHVDPPGQRPVRQRIG